MSGFDKLVESFRDKGMSPEAAMTAAIGRDYRTEAEARRAWEAAPAQAGVAQVVEADRAIGSAYTAAVAAAQSRYRMSEANARAYVSTWVSDSLARLVREAGGTTSVTESASRRPGAQRVNVREVA